LQDDSGKSTIFITSDIRLILENAATTQEAVDLISEYNLHSDVNYHLLVCDGSGDSRAIEVVDNRTSATPTDIMTNHYVTEHGADVDVSESSGERYSIIREALEADDSMSEDEVKSVLISIHQSNPDKIHFTRWSVIYDLAELDCVVWMVTPFDKDGELDYDDPYRFSLRN
jgi:predicted choloylglycine hydrolase